MRRFTSLVLGLMMTLSISAEALHVPVDRIQVQSMGSMMVYMLYDDPNERVFVYPLLLQEGETDAKDGKTYVYPGEMSKTYAYWMLSDYKTHALYTEATFRMTLNETNEKRIDATATDTNGDSFELLYDETSESLGKEQVTHNNKVQKVLQNGQILIIQNDRKFTITGNRTY
jgi:hypothetical protein